MEAGSKPQFPPFANGDTDDERAHGRLVTKPRRRVLQRNEDVVAQVFELVGPGTAMSSQGRHHHRPIAKVEGLEGLEVALPHCVQQLPIEVIAFFAGRIV